MYSHPPHPVKVLLYTAKIGVYYFIIVSLSKYLASIYWIKSTKLQYNDSLSFLYILSSSVYTIFLLLFLIWFITNKKRALAYSSVTRILGILCYFLYVVGAQNYAITFLQISSINSTLQNGLLNTHPALIYYMYSHLIHSTMRLYLYSTFKGFYIFTTSHFHLSIVLSLAGIYLGAFWASQELNWGGFWSWDPVEIISLCGTLFMVKFIHNKTSHVINQPSARYAITLWIVYIIIRLGAVSTVHSFIRASNVGLYVNISMTAIFFYCVLYLKATVDTSLFFLQNNYKRNFYKIQSTILFIYAHSYLLYLTTFYNWSFILISLSDLFICVHVFAIYYFIILHDFINKRNLKYLNSFLFLGLCIISNLNHTFLFLSIFYLFFGGLIVTHISLHLIIFFVYSLYFIFMSNIPIYNVQMDLVVQTHALANSYVSQGQLNFYETHFYLKKNAFLNKLKNFLVHTTGFNVLTNGPASLYYFSKNFLVKNLFSLEVLYVVFPALMLLFVMFFKPLCIINLNINNKN